MAALAAAKIITNKYLRRTQRYLMKASTTIYAGGMVSLDANGLALPASDTATDKGVVGLALQTVTSAASGSYYVECEEGVFLLAGSSLTQAGQGGKVTIVDDQTVGLAAGTTNDITAGILVEYVSATSGWVDIGPAHLI